MSDTAGSFPMITEGDLHPHLRARMAQRGVTLEEIRHTLKNGWPATDDSQGSLWRRIPERSYL